MFLLQQYIYKFLGFLVLTFLLFSSSAYASVYVPNPAQTGTAAGGTAAATNFTSVMGNTPLTNSYVVALVDSLATSNGAPSNVHDSNSNNFTLELTKANGTSLTAFIYDIKFISGGTGTITCTSNAGSSCDKFLVFEIDYATYASYYSTTSASIPSFTINNVPTNSVVVCNISTSSATETMTFTNGYNSAFINNGTAHSFGWTQANGGNITCVGGTLGTSITIVAVYSPAPCPFQLFGCLNSYVYIHRIIPELYI